MVFTTFAEFLAYLDSLGMFSMQLGLSRMIAAMERVGVGRMGTVVHVVGTNGKGSTSGFLAALARAQGLCVGLYASPHLVSVRERIRINGRMVSEERWLSAANEVMARCADVGLTYFELLTVMAQVLFQEAGVDVVILEAGLGGTHDATCAVSADLVVVTPVGLDHLAVLGPTLLDIARDKGGALGRCPAVCGTQTRDVLAVLERCSAPWPLMTVMDTLGDFVPAQAWNEELSTVHPPYQRENAELAMLAWHVLAQRHGWIFDSALCTRTLVRTRFPARFCRHGRVLVDGAHNDMGLSALCAALEERGEHFDRMVFQSMRDKVLSEGVLRRLHAVADEVWIPPLPGVDRACPPEALVARFGTGAWVAPDLEGALGRKETVLVCGSLYLAGAYYALYPEQLRGGFE